MSLAAIGPKDIFLQQRGLSYGDIVLLLDYGRKRGNFATVTQNEELLFDAIQERFDVLLRRRGLTDPSRMISQWSQLNPVSEGRNMAFKSDSEELSAFSWTLVTIVCSLDLCMTNDRIQACPVAVLGALLSRDDSVEGTLRIVLPTNIESWRSFGRARGMNIVFAESYVGARRRFVDAEAIPQLSPSDEGAVRSFLVWLVTGVSVSLKTESVEVYAMAAASQSS